MSKQQTRQVKAFVPYLGKDISQVYKRNVDRYFAEIEKTMPQYIQSMSNYQKTFFDTWKNTVDAVYEGKIANATLDATQKNVEAFYQSAKKYADLNNNLVESWFTAFKRAWN